MVMKKKILLVVMALIIAAIGTMSGCDTKKSEKSEKTTESQTEIENSEDEENKEDGEDKENKGEIPDLLSQDKVYKDYLSQQKICKISKTFKISFDGSIRDNPNGLASAVKYDFSGDKKDDLITFTFERNKADKEDIRIDYVKYASGKLEVTDSVYLMDILDAETFGCNYGANNYNRSLYYSNNGASFEITTSEYNGELYIGCLLTETGYLGGVSTRYSLFNVITITDDKIDVQMSGIYDHTDEGHYYIVAEILPPALREKLQPEKIEVKPNSNSSMPYNTQAAENVKEIDKFAYDKGKYLLYFSPCFIVDPGFTVEGGAYETPAQAYSALFNEFGLDIEQSIDYPQKEHFISKNNSTIKTIMVSDQIIDKSEYIGVKLSFDSDLEEILGVDDPFNNYSDETDYYKDILMYQYYFPEVWDYFKNDDNTYPECEYSIFDMNNDGKKELIIRAGMYGDFLVIKPDSTIVITWGKDEIENQNYYSSYGKENYMFYDNGIIVSSDLKYDFYEGRDIGSIYVDINSGQIFYWSGDESTGGYHLRSNTDTSFDISDNEIDEKVLELKSGNCLIPEFHSVNEVKYQNTLEIEDPENLKFDNYQDAYKAEIERLRAQEQEDGYSYSLFYLDDDDIPELFIEHYNHGSVYSVYTFTNSNVHNVYSGICADAGGRRAEMSGYIEREGILDLTSWDSMGRYMDKMIVKYDDRAFTNLCSSYLEGEAIPSSELAKIEEAKYIVNGSETTKENYDKEFAKYDNKFKKLDVFYDYNEIIRVLNGEKVEKEPVTQPETKATDAPSDDKTTATVKAGGGLNMRRTPSTDGEKVTLIPDGATVQVEEVDGEWSYVTYDGKSGWVKNSYLR